MASWLDWLDSLNAALDNFHGHFAAILCILVMKAVLLMEQP